MLESLNLPTIYSRGQESEYFNQWTYWKNILLATVYGIVSMLIVYCVMEGGVVDQYGRVSYLSESAMILYFSMVLVVNVKVLLMSHGHTPILLVPCLSNLVLDVPDICILLAQLLPLHRILPQKLNRRELHLAVQQPHDVLGALPPVLYRTNHRLYFQKIHRVQQEIRL
jgi:magnesium-transporting ATPase (P-type)